MHIAIAGNIGSGKTTLTGMLCEHFGWPPLYEDVDNNPYLNDFYDNMLRWSFNLQIYFLNSRFGQLQRISTLKEPVVQDRTIYEDAYIFAANLRDMNLMSVRDYDTYRSLFDRMVGVLQPPDLLVYLRASVPTLVRQIKKRGRTYESAIRTEYLQRLNERYEQWISSYKLGKLLIIDVDHIQFSENERDFKIVLSKIDKALK